MIDLTKNTEAWCLMSDQKRAAFEAHKGPIVFLCADGSWAKKTSDEWQPDWVYRAAPQPVRGEVVRYLDEYCEVISCKQNEDDTHRFTLPTLDGKLIPGTYTGPDGATIVVAVL